MKFDLQDLEYFLAVVHARSFTKAAQARHVSQPALSRKIQEMEKRLGAVLLERTTRKVGLTEAGKAFQRYASAILESCEMAEQAVAHFSAEEKQVLELGYGSRAQFEYLLRLITVLHRDFPDLKINATHGTTFDRLYLRQLDAAFLMEGTVQDQDFLDYMQIDQSGLSVFFPKGLFPEDKEDISVSELAGYRFMIPEKHVSAWGIRFVSLHEQILAQMQRLEIPREAFHTGYDAQAFCSWILSERQLGIMPDSSRVITNHLLASLPLRECRQGFGIVLAWNRGNAFGERIRALQAAGLITAGV